MFYIVESSKSFAEVIFDLEPVVQRLGFVILGSNDLGETLRRKGIDLDEECQVFDLCNYRYLERVLADDMRMALTVPWRISVFTEQGATKLGVLRPPAMLPAKAPSAALAKVLAEIEEKLILIVDETR